MHRLTWLAVASFLVGLLVIGASSTFGLAKTGPARHSGRAHPVRQSSRAQGRQAIAAAEAWCINQATITTPAAFTGAARGWLTCHGPVGPTELEVCGQEYSPHHRYFINTKCEKEKGFGSLNIQFRFRCSHGLALRTWLWDWAWELHPSVHVGVTTKVTCPI